MAAILPAAKRRDRWCKTHPSAPPNKDHFAWRILEHGSDMPPAARPPWRSAEAQGEACIDASWHGMAWGGDSVRRLPGQAACDRFASCARQGAPVYHARARLAIVRGRARCRALGGKRWGEGGGRLLLTYTPVRGGERDGDKDNGLGRTNGVGSGT